MLCVLFNSDENSDDYEDYPEYMKLVDPELESETNANELIAR